MNTGNNVELVGATRAAVALQGGEVQTSVALDQTVRRAVSASLTPGPGKMALDRVFLNLENVQGTADSTAFRVYVGLPADATAADHPELLAGSVVLFGVRKASLPDGEHGGNGLNFVIEITDIVDKLHLTHQFDVDALNVRLVPTNDVPASANIRIGRISIYRQGE